MSSDEFVEERTVKKTTGPADHFITTYTDGVWGFAESDENQWAELEAGDIVLFHSTGTDTDGNNQRPGVVGYGVVSTTDTKDVPLWRSEKRDQSNDWPYLVWFGETCWRGNVDEIRDEPIESKSLERISRETAALTDNRLTFETIESNDLAFPKMGSFSTPSDGEALLELLQSEPLTRVRYRDRPTDGDAEPVGSKGSENADQSVRNQPVGTALEIEFDDGLFDGLYFSEDDRETLATKLESALNAGKHVILTGPPGTGKTELAENVCEQLQETGLYTGYHVTTATADWSTFDTVGGYMPESSGDGALDFTPGQVLRRFASGDAWRNEPLVVDEINRADIDKAFGQLFTLLSGQRVQLPFEKDGTEVELLPAGTHEPGHPLESHEYLVPRSWRLLATMNSYDKTSLYEMSYAFMRRFAFVRVPVPTLSDERSSRIRIVRKYVDVWGLDVERDELAAVSNVWYSMNEHGRPIGPALVKDMLASMSRMRSLDLPERTAEAVTSFVLPQLEGVPDREAVLRALVEDVDIDRGRLATAADEMLRTSLADG